MTTTAPPRALAADGRGRLPAPVRDRRPALAALALLLVLGGALTSALLAYRSGDRVDVLVARGEIKVGQQVGTGDFGIARVAADGVEQIRKDDAKNFGGSYATTGIPAGTLLNKNMFRAGSVVPDRAVVVGVVVSASQRPAEDIRTGDVVRVFSVPREAGSAQAGSVLAQAVRVAEVTPGGGEALRLSLLVPEGSATAMVAAASTNTVAVSRLSADTVPAIDFRKER